MSHGRRGRPKGLPKTGGRKKGTPNRKTLLAGSVDEFFAHYGYNPIAALIETRQRKRGIPAELKTRIDIELANYLYARRKAVEIMDRPAEGQKQPLGEWLQQQLEFNTDPGTTSPSPPSGDSTPTSEPSSKATPGQSEAASPTPSATKPFSWRN